MAVDQITPTDPRIERKSAVLNGIAYSYLLAEPKDSKASATIFLVHGWPDCALGWRYQIPALLSLNLRVVVPDMMGYSHSSAPADPKFYTFKRASDDLALLARELGVENGKLILGGHDWGGAVVYRFAMWYPELIGGIMAFCTPFFTPRTKFTDQSEMPNFRYQKQLRGKEVEEGIVSKEQIGNWLRGMYGGRTPDGKAMFTVGHGVHFDLLEQGIGKSPLMSEEEMGWYIDGYSRNGLQGPLNWYRTGKLNWEDEKEMAERIEKEGWVFGCPTLFVAGTNDAALPPSLSTGMERHFRVLKRGEVNAGHWMLWERPEEVNAYIKEFLGELVPKLGGSRAVL